jgi:nucleoside-diphosphate-sugar epimerase
MSQLHVIFGTGSLGRHTALELLRLGHRVRLVNRSGRIADLPSGAELVAGDANDLETARRLTTDASVVYQCAQPAYHRWAQEFPALQRSILEAAVAAGAKLVIADNLYMYGDPHGRALREDHPYDATTKKGKVRAAMARDALQAHAAGRLEVALVRGSNFFGPHEPVMLELAFKPALTGSAVKLMGRLDQPHTFSYTPDFGRALATIGSTGQGFGRAWHVPSDAPVTQRRLLELLEAHAGRPVKHLVASSLVLSIMGLFNPTMNEAREMLHEWTHPFVMDSSDFRRTFGWQATPLGDAVRDTMTWARHQISVQTVSPRASA